MYEFNGFLNLEEFILIHKLIFKSQFSNPISSLLFSYNFEYLKTILNDEKYLKIALRYYQEIIYLRC